MLLSRYIQVQTILIFFCLLLSLNVYSQKEASIWYFGDKAGLNFNKGSDIRVTDGEMQTIEGCATISDANGNLLFYTNGGSNEWTVNAGLDGGTIWNKNHEAMYQMNGMEGGGISSHQSAIILPKPKSSNVYYVLTMDEFEASANGSLRGLSYFEVDMNLNGGLGEVTTYVESVYANAYEVLSAVPMAEDDGFWVVIQDIDSKDYLVYSLTESGLNLNGSYAGSGCCMLTFSPDGSKVFSVGYLYDFDKITGVISNELKLTIAGTITWSFSPNSRYLYTMAEASDDFYRYDLSVDDINSSATYLFAISNINTSRLQLAPDGNIYFLNLSGFTSHLNAILCPNSETACLKKDIYSFPITKYWFNHLPNFNDHAFASDLEQVALEVDIDATSLIISPGETVTLTANHYLADSYLWSNNESTQSITIEEAGIYTVTINDGCCSHGTTEIEIIADSTSKVNDFEYPIYQIYPNPANEFFNIVFENGQNFDLSLFDALGRVILHNVEYAEQAKVETNDLLSGTYWLKIKLNGKVHWERLDVVR